MRVRAPDHDSVNHSGKLNVLGKKSPAGDFFDCVQTNLIRTDGIGARRFSFRRRSSRNLSSRFDNLAVARAPAKVARNGNPDLIIGVGGCVASQEGEEIGKRAPYVDLVFGRRASLTSLSGLIDRVRLQEVVDFLQFDLQLFIFPDFNVADSAIVIGVSLLLLDVLTAEAQDSVPREPEAEG